MNVQSEGRPPFRRVLVVDDDPIFREMIHYVLSQQNIDVKTAPDGPTALDMLATEPFDILFVDFQMPGMNGLEVAAAARRLHATLPIALLTGSVDALPPADLRAAGISQMFTKPFDLDELMHWINSHAPP